MFLTLLLVIGGVSACSTSSEIQIAAEQDEDFVALKDRFEERGLTCEWSDAYFGISSTSSLSKQTATVDCLDPDVASDGFNAPVEVLYVSGADGGSGIRQRIVNELCWSGVGKKRDFHPDGKFVIDYSLDYGGKKFSPEERSWLMGVTPQSWWKFCGQKAVDTYKTIAPVIDVEARDACQRISSVYEGWLSSGERFGTVKGNAKYELLVSELTDTLAPTGPLKTRVGDASITDAYRYLDSSGTAFDPVHVYAGLLNFATRLVGVRADFGDILWSPDFVEDTYLQDVKRPCGNFK
jgi:hypothetical protein